MYDVGLSRGVGRSVLLTSAFVALLILDLAGAFWLVTFVVLGLAFTVVGHGGLWFPSIIIGIPANAILLWLTYRVGRTLGVW